MSGWICNFTASDRLPRLRSVHQTSQMNFENGEEGMLYPMAERALAVDWPELREQLDAFELD
jgi:hypothetical protein